MNGRDPSDLPAMARRPTGWRAWLCAAVPAVCLLLPAGGCAPPPEPASVPVPAPPKASGPQRQGPERPGPDGPWRPYVLQRCLGTDRLPSPAESDLAECWALYRKRSGSDAIMTLELYLEDHGRDGLVLLTLGQLYLLAGQGEPELLPREGPAADVGDWPANQVRLLGRARQLLRQAGRLRPDDAAVDYLLADVARAAGDTNGAAQAIRSGLRKCSLPRSLDVLQRYQELQPHPARLLQSVAPDYPQEALREKLSGTVDLDVLIGPDGRAAQEVPVSSPDPLLTSAAAAALEQASYEPARLGKYPIWSWLRVPTRFTLEP